MSDLDYQWSPNYTGLPTLRVADSVIGLLPSLSTERRRWRRARTRALREWSATGLIFDVYNNPGHPSEPDYTLPDMGLLDAPNTLYLLPASVRQEEEWSTVAAAAWGPTEAGPDSGVAWFKGVVYTNPATWWIRTIIAHETGHLLSLGHGGTGVMGTGQHVSGEEVDMVHSMLSLTGDLP